MEIEHCHPCEECGAIVGCSDCCDGDQQTIVYCDECAGRGHAGKERGE